MSPDDVDPNGEIEVWAAGGVVERDDEPGSQILIVHRPRHDDWSLPKGKLDPGETFVEAAHREILEETGFDSELGEVVATVRYQDSADRSKAVVYFTGTVRDGAFAPNDEVDQIRWCTPLEAATLLTYPHDAGLVVDLFRSRAADA